MIVYRCRLCGSYLGSWVRQLAPGHLLLMVAPRVLAEEEDLQHHHHQHQQQPVVGLTWQLLHRWLQS